MMTRVCLPEKKSMKNTEHFTTQPQDISGYFASVFTFLRDPHQLHRFSSFVWEMEENLHQRRTNIFLCLRCKLGSDEIASKMFDNMDEPRWFKKKFCFASKYLKILPPVLLKILLPISRGFLLTWDVVKDVTLWVFLYNRIGFLL